MLTKLKFFSLSFAIILTTSCTQEAISTDLEKHEQAKKSTVETGDNSEVQELVETKFAPTEIGGLFPNEAYTKILVYITQPSDISALCRTCTSFYEYIPEFFRPKKLKLRTNKSSPKRDYSLLKAFTKVEELKLYLGDAIECNYAALREILKNLTALKSLDLRTNEINKEHLKQLFSWKASDNSKNFTINFPRKDDVGTVMQDRVLSSDMTLGERITLPFKLDNQNPLVLAIKKIGGLKLGTYNIPEFSILEISPMTSRQFSGNFHFGFIPNLDRFQMRDDLVLTIPSITFVNGTFVHDAFSNVGGKSCVLYKEITPKPFNYINRLELIINAKSHQLLEQYRSVLTAWRNLIFPEGVTTSTPKLLTLVPDTDIDTE